MRGLTGYDPFATVSKRQLVLSIAIGVAATIVGFGLLMAAADTGADVADFSRELGVAVGLSGLVWWASSRIRRDRIDGRTDLSAILLLALLGAAGVAWAVKQGKPMHEVFLALGAAFSTLWLFGTLERLFVIKPEKRLPLILEILFAPVIALIWFALRGWPEPAGPLDTAAATTAMELEQELNAWDADSSLRVPGAAESATTATAADASRKLGFEFPTEMVAWLDQHAGDEVELTNGSRVQPWTWTAIALQPVDLPNQVVAFAQQHRSGPADGASQEYILAIDLRPGPFQNAVVRGMVKVGRQPKWPVSGNLEPLAGSFGHWRRHCLG